MRVLLRLVIFIRESWWLLAIAFLCQTATTGFSLAVPRLLGDGIDDVLSQGSRTGLIIAAAAILGALTLRGAFAYGQTWFSQLISQKTSYTIRNKLFNHLQKLSYSFHDRAQTGELMSRGTVDIAAVQMFFGNGLLGITQIVIMFTGVSWLILSMDWKLALLCMAVVPLVGWRSIYFRRSLEPLWMKIQELMAALGTVLEESLTGIRIVKSFTREKEENQKFTTRATDLYNQELGVARVMAINSPFLVFLMTIPIALIIWYGGRQVIAGELTIGHITQFILYLNMMLMPVRRLGFMVNMLSRTQMAGQRILEILDTQPAVLEKPDAVDLGRLKGQVTFENVSFSYDSTGPALEDITFSVQPGQLVALLGGSGSGKSTISKLISRFYDVTSGRITVDGTDIRDATLASLRRNVITCQQDIFLFSDTIRDNIAYGSVDAASDQVEVVAKAASLHDFVTSLPDGYDTWVGERGITLSGGEKQRLAIARTLLMNPSILLLDDATSSVDAGTEHLIRQALGELIKDRTTFIITHRLPIIKNADLILLLDKGRIIEMGNHEELMAKRGHYYQTYQLQIAVSDDFIEGT